MLRVLSLSAAIFSCWVGMALATENTMRPVDYPTLEATLTGRVTFDEYPAIREPGHLIDGLYAAPGVLIGERFEGQTLLIGRNAYGQKFDALAGWPTAPLLVRAGATGETLTIALHRGFGSMAGFALGPVGYPEITARGEGAMAVFFEADQPAVGLRLHADYADPLGARPPPGVAEIKFFARDGTPLGHLTVPLQAGVQEIAQSFDRGGVAGFTLTTTDPGGLAVDDILYTLPAASS